MRYFWVPFIFLCVAVVGFAGFRGKKSQKPPIEIFADMDRQPKLRPQERNAFFADGVSSQLPVEGTIERSEPLSVGGSQIYPFEEHAVNTGRIAGKTNFVNAIPMAVNSSLLERGRGRFNIYCAVCHGKQGDGQGVVGKFGIAGVANLHMEPFVKMPDGYIFHVVTHGAKPMPDGTMRMPGYGAALDISDRWAIVAYMRALQRSRLAVMDDVPEPQRAQFD